MIKRKVGVAIIAFVIASFSSAQEKIALTLNQAVEYAVANNRDLKLSDIDLEIKKRASSNSWNVFLPDLTVSGRMSRENEFSPEKMTTFKNEFKNEEERWSTVGIVSANLNLNFAYIGNIRKAKAEYETGKISFEQSQKNVILNVKKLFYGLLLQQENLKIQKTTLENARQRMVQAQTSFKNGAIPELSLLQTQVNYQNSKPDVDSAEQSLNQQLDTFSFMLGLPVGTKIELVGTIEPKYVDVDAQSLLDKYGQNDLSLKSLDSNINAAKIGISALNMKTWLPNLSIGYAWQPAYIGDKGAWHFSSDIGKDEKWYDSGNLSLTLSWNITNMLPWSSNQQQIKNIKQQVKQAEIRREMLLENQKMNVRKAVDTLNMAKSQIDAMRRNVTVAQQAYDATYKQYRNGMTELLNLRDAESSLNKAKLGLMNQKFSYISALMDLENTLNTTLSE